MTEGMHIHTRWCHPLGKAGTTSSLAEWSLSINGQVVTELEDLVSERVREHSAAPMELLGEWLAAHWWRLRWEPELPHPDLGWRMSHQLPAIGGGVAWPNLTMASDGDFIHCRCRPTSRSTRGGMPVRFLAHFDDAVPAASFEQAVDRFMSSLVERLGDSRQREDIVLLWQEVCGERQDRAATTWRRLEALLGFDADDGPEELVSRLIARFDELGQEAVSEVAADGRQETLALLSQLESAASRATEGALPPGDRALRESLKGITATQPVWRRAAEAARMARRQWGLGSGPITDAELLDLFRLPSAILTEGHPQQPSVALRTDSGLRIALGRKRLTGRRFALARILADELLSPSEDRMLPVTESRTARQRFLRAFAQEFLCPFSSLEEEIGSRPVNDDFIEDAADRFGVSSQAVYYLLVNRGVLDVA